MIKEIPFNGVTTTPDDYLSQDGDLSYCSDLIYEDGSLKTAPATTEIFKLPEGYKLLYIHKGHDYCNYICYSGTDLCYCSSQDTDTFTDLNIQELPTSITSVGNDLIVTISEGMRHNVYRDNSYTLLPLNLPQLDQRFGLVGTYNNSSYEDRVVISDDGSQFYYPNKVASTYINAVTWNYEKGDIDFTPMHKNITGNYTQGWYRISISISQIGSFAKAVVRGYNTDPDHPVYEAVLGDKGSVYMDQWNFVFFFKVDKTFSNFAVALRASNEAVETIAMVNIHEASEHADYALTKNNDVDSFAIVTGAVKRFIQEESLNKNRHIFPFFARTALRMYDGTYISLSAPCLLIPNSGQTPVTQLLIDNMGSGSPSAAMTVSALCCELQYRLKDTDILRAWKDYIKDIVIAITPPIYPIDLTITDESELRKNYIITTNDQSGFSVAALTDDSDSPLSHTYPHDVYRESEIYRMFVSNNRDNHRIQLPSVKDYIEEFEKSNTFYIIKSIPVDEIVDNNKYEALTTIDLGDIALNNLVNYQSLPDDHSSLNAYLPNLTKAYNNRLHIADYSQKSFEGYNPSDFGGFTREEEKYYNYIAVVTFTDSQNTYTVRSKVKHLYNDSMNELRYFFYPHIYAKKATVYMTNTTGQFFKAELTLKQHPYTSGSYWFDNFNHPTWQEITDEAEISKVNAMFITDPEPTLINKENYMKISELNNPLTFTDQRTYTFDSKILALSAIVTALSSGQAGDFDMYVLTESDGVWTLKINNEGAYTNQIPVTRDTIINAKSLTQLDNSILFATARGLMNLQGSQSTCISEDLNNRQHVSINNSQLAGISNLIDSEISTDYDFRDYIKMAEISYDYTNQRIIVFRSDKDYCYTYSLKSHKWTLLNIDLQYTVNSYPDAYVVDSTGSVINLSQEDPDSGSKAAIILTRPFDIDDSNNFKLIDKLRINGIIHSNVSQILYGSNDLTSWHIVSSSNNYRMAGNNAKNAGSYRFFRLALRLNIDSTESIDSFTVSYRIKEENTNLF